MRTRFLSGRSVRSGLVRLTVVAAMVAGAVQVPGTATASASEWMNEYDRAMSSDLSRRVHAMWEEAYASPEFQALVAERAARPAPPRVAPPSVKAIEMPKPLTPAEYA